MEQLRIESILPTENCPFCEHQESKSSKKTAALNPSSKIILDRVCVGCGCHFRPPAPQWIPYPGLIVGIGFFVFPVVLSVSVLSGNGPKFPLMYLAGGTVLFFAMGSLLTKQMWSLLRKGDPTYDVGHCLQCDRQLLADGRTHDSPFYCECGAVFASPYSSVPLFK